MDKFSSLLTDYLLKSGVIEEEYYEIYQYGLLTGTEMLICIITCYLFAIQMGMFGMCTLSLVILFCLRSFVGGLHLQNFKACYICSCLAIILILLAAQNLRIPRFYSLIIFIIEVFVIASVSPVENVNRPVDDNEKRTFSKRIKIILDIIFALSIIFYILNLNRYLNTVTYTLGIVLVSMLLGKAKIIFQKVRVE